MVGFFYGEFLRIKGTDLNFRNPHIINGGRNKIDFWILRGGAFPRVFTGNDGFLINFL
jgi:hypothetical protein